MNHFRPRASQFLALAALLWTYAAQAQSTLWETHNDAGREAYRAGRYAEAEKEFQSALAEAEKFGPSDSRLATSLNNLAQLYRAQGLYERAEPLYKRLLAIREKALGPDHPDVAMSLHNLAALYLTQSKCERAEPLYKRSLAIWEKALGPDHPDVATVLENYAQLLRDTKRKAEAQRLEKRAAAIREKKE